MLVGKYPVDGAKNHHMMYGKVLDSDYHLPCHISDSAAEVTLRVSLISSTIEPSSIIFFVVLDNRNTYSKTLMVN